MSEIKNKIEDISEIDKRKIVMRELKEIGLTYANIGEALGVSRQRVEQMINTHYESLLRYTPKIVKGYNIISLLLKMRGMSINKLAKSINVTPTTLYNKIKRFPDLKKLKRIQAFKAVQAQKVASFFGEEVDALFDKIKCVPSWNIQKNKNEEGGNKDDRE